MKTVFADTYFWLAILNKTDAAHRRATDYLIDFKARIVTTEWILVEVADALAGTTSGRGEFFSLYEDVKVDSEIKIVQSNTELFQEGIRFYGGRADKHWSLTDCLSFVVMKREGLTEALTGDHHFEQAGYLALLK